ncbi:bifunctional 3-deoxy-7-phosphoheptulonate synthase/chorismate mutase type II [Carboxylicivirga mesophila]|uniref:chorismate mutase n=2 Tax=Carboxylicivirga TaxID=1628153 RepID=A0A941F760_9BACT|nr:MULTISPECIES: bifunctional 3-deoxy-7-phosphoheptulonate synthase/chorismate mutase type II [Carboxylicivirga]MBR8536899.1 bifunctional 3-deoxy-7-phosphoheptulonate synthase/chorismate mutase type II [Carboxylicivirga sediminis]MBS2212803.1 bifunctional 3-deoxy-7-phosphoheptulonate synthase/chorismate mutase type II [Carboxylicivirga mesophila]
MEHKLDLQPLALPGLELKRPIIIAGPCSAETEEQTLETARQLAAQGVKIFRAGIWKPRTRPGAFEGVGTVGLPWLKKVKEETGMFVSVEVANAHHVYEALKFGVDMLWIGARTTANPFAVQEVADALTGVDKPVLIKNPVNPDLELWIGAIERVNRAGVKMIGAIHRGFSTYDKTKYRNNPEWQIPIELRRRIPELPIITDPSHISGKSEMIAEISQEAMDLNFNGLIIESHMCPEKAWSDASQQVTPQHLGEIKQNLVVRRSAIGDTPRVTLDELRQKIDSIDKQLLETLKSRMKISEAIGKYKYENNITILQTRRYDEVMNNRRKQAEEVGLSPEFVVKVYEHIHEESINRQNKVMNKELAKK